MAVFLCEKSARFGVRILNCEDMCEDGGAGNQILLVIANPQPL